MDNFSVTENIPSNCIFDSYLRYKPKVTIAICTFKRPELLKDALQSSIDQKTFDYYDIVVVDNNPIRGCETEQFMLQIPEKKIISYYKNSENLGMVGSWNRCIELSKGEFISILHDDDMLHPNFISESVKLINENKFYFAFTVLKGKYISQWDWCNNELNNNVRRFKSQHFLFGNLSPFPGVVFNKDIARSLGGFDQKKYPISDYDFWIRLSEGNKCFLSDKKLAFYRISDVQETKSCYVDLVVKTWQRRKEIKYYRFLKFFSNYELYKMYINYNPCFKDHQNLFTNHYELFDEFKIMEKIYSRQISKFLIERILNMIYKIIQVEI